MKLNETNKDIKVEDITTAYQKGYFKVIKVEKRWKNPNDSMDFVKSELPTEKHTVPIGELITYVKYSDEFGKLSKPGKINQCDIAFCIKAVDIVDAQIVDLKNKIEQLEKFKKLL